MADTPGKKCTYFKCPGKLKCHKSYCIYMSSVCDNHYDCEEGEDEIFCPLASCPGMLKCRGENRCVSKEEICDSHLNCLYSMDDEIGCHKCPKICYCDGYSMKCHLENTLDLIAANHISHVIKGLILRGIQQRILINNIYLSRLVYLNASLCGIENIWYSKNKIELNLFIIVASFMHNKLIEVTFIRASIFTNVVYLDLSYNHLSLIKRNESFAFKKLLVFVLKGNPINEIDLSTSQYGSMPSVMDIQYLYLSLGLRIEFPADLSKHIHVKVSDLMVCCFMC